jgi:hypothetical protein
LTGTGTWKRFHVIFAIKCIVIVYVGVESSKEIQNEIFMAKTWKKPTVSIIKLDEKYDCPLCGAGYPSSRFAPHLEKCLGMGRASSRAARTKVQEFL